MARKAQEMGPLAVSKLTTPGLHAVGGVAGLALQVSESGARSWVLRAMIAGRRRDMGLGGFPDVTLAGAREAARAARAKIKAGKDPIEEARQAKSELLASLAKNLTFEQCATAYIAAHEPSWKSAKHRAQWQATLGTYAYPVFGSLLVRDVELPHVLEVLESIWRTKTETASRLRGRIELVLDWATARGYREGLNPARWKGHLSVLLPSPNKIAKEEHYQALPAGQMGTFMQVLREQAGMGAKALEFAVLTAARSGEIRGASWSEFDLEAGEWTIPAERMKAGREHRVPLSPRALEILRAQPRIAGSEWVFPAPRGGLLSDMTLSAVLRRMKVAAVPHGFRSTFRDWCAEHTNYPREVAEMALAHAIENKVEAAYRRGDLFEKRRRLMNEWADFCAQPSIPKNADVIPLRAERA